MSIETAAESVSGIRRWIAAWIVLALSISSVAGADSGNSIELTVSSFFPPNHVQIRDVVAPWARNIERLSGGSVAVSIRTDAALGPAPTQFDLARDGVADIAIGLPAYTPGRFPLSSVFELPFLVSDAESGSIVLWEIYRTHLQREYSDVKVLWMFVHGPGQLLTQKPVRTLEDLRGMKIRSPGPTMFRVLEKLGAVPVAAPMDRAYDMLIAGEVEGAVAPWEAVVPFRLHEQCGFATVLDLYTLPFFAVMNRRKYDALPPSIRKILDENSGESMAFRAGEAFDAAESAGKALFLETGGRLSPLAPEEKQRWNRIAFGVGDDWAAEMNRRGLPGVEIIEAVTELLLQIQ